MAHEPTREAPRESPGFVCMTPNAKSPEATYGGMGFRMAGRLPVSEDLTC